MAWILVPSSSMTSSFSSIVIVNSMTFGPALVACSCGVDEGRRDELDLLARELVDGHGRGPGRRRQGWRGRRLPSWRGG